MKIAFILGTRPEIIKLASLMNDCISRKIDFIIIHTNQHYSFSMDKVFFDELELPEPNYNLNIGSGLHGEQTGKMLMGIEKVLMQENPDFVIVQGDTNTVLAGTLAAVKLGIKICHVEAGLRSFDRSMPEEINRIIADHSSDFLFCPTVQTKKLLQKEGIELNKIFIVGNTVVDALLHYRNLASSKSSILDKLGIYQKDYILLTLHRPSNVDNKEVLENLIMSLAEIIKIYGFHVIFPIHPRTLKMLDVYNISMPANVIITDPVGYFDFINLESNAKLIMTDSGGVQEEACVLRIPCVTLRENTERPETVQFNFNILAGVENKNILTSVKQMLERKLPTKLIYGDGTASRKILDILSK